MEIKRKKSVLCPFERPSYILYMELQVHYTYHFDIHTLKIFFIKKRIIDAMIIPIESTEKTNAIVAKTLDKVGNIL